MYKYNDGDARPNVHGAARSSPNVSLNDDRSALAKDSHSERFVTTYH
jgi:hypothetical protein